VPSGPPVEGSYEVLAREAEPRFQMQPA
jgi:hypothetical protein